jgi:hypothetical protein
MINELFLASQLNAQPNPEILTQINKVEKTEQRIARVESKTKLFAR